MQPPHEAPIYKLLEIVVRCVRNNEILGVHRMKLRKHSIASARSNPSKIVANIFSTYTHHKATIFSNYFLLSFIAATTTPFTYQLNLPEKHIKRALSTGRVTYFAG
jgi:hypothetical protein